MYGHKESPAATPTVTDSDLYIAAAWSVTPAEWLNLSNEARIDYRDRVVFAPNRAAVSA